MIYRSPTRSGRPRAYPVHWRLEVEATAVPNVDNKLARTVSRQMSALRRFFEDEGFLEVLTPHLTRNRTIPFRNTFQIESPDGSFQGALRVGAALFLAESVSELKRAYAITTSFRAEMTPGAKLGEFRLAEAWADGDLSDVRQLAEDALRRQLQATINEAALPAEKLRRLKSVKFPLRSVTYDDAMQHAGLTGRERPTDAVASKIVEAYGSQPMFVTHLPENLETPFTDVRLNEDGKHLGFVLLAPFAGTLMSGGELETDYERLSAQVDRSAFLKELLNGGGTREQLDRYVRSIARLDTPHSKLAIGFERVTQFLVGASQIEDAAVLPVRVEVRPGGRRVIIIDFIIIIDEPEPI